MAKTSSPRKKTKAPNISKVAIMLHGQEYIVTCGAGEEKKLGELVKFVDNKLSEAAKTGTNVTETRLFMLTCLLLADELLETRKAATQIRKDDESLMVAAVDHLRDRVLSIAEIATKG
ncbi:MAG TPA: hypothetical protein DD400_04095 [Rhodospirillaceae bacterium]|nr:hypothetical protein [Rhodospirillaceae bacterium]